MPSRRLWESKRELGMDFDGHCRAAKKAYNALRSKRTTHSEIKKYLK